MKILLAPDKFKGSLSAQAVCEALSKGLKKANTSINTFSKPLADGGDGSLAVLAHYFPLETVTLTVQDPLGRTIQASYKKTATTAYIEMAAASGLVLLKPEERNCMLTTTFGTGQLIAHAIQKGIKEIYLFIGGSATNDGGIGIANALGYQFYNIKGQQLAPIGKNLSKIHTIENSHSFYDWNAFKIHVICDVNNPLYGKNGASHVYAKQKGANLNDILHLEQGLINLANCLVKQGYPNIANIAGAGAAGGVGGGAIAFLNAQLQSGIQTFLKITKIEENLKACDLIITGEGKLDNQTEQGKVVSGICTLAKKYNKPVIAVCGIAEFPVSKNLPIKKIYTIIDKAKSLDDAMENAYPKLIEIGKEIGLTYKVS